MKKISFGILAFCVLIFCVSCKQSSAYEQGNLLDYFAGYEKESFVFPKAAWGTSVEEVAGKLGAVREDMEDMGNEQFRLKKRISFSEPSCTGYLTCIFQDDALVSVGLSISNSFSIEEEEEYPEIDLQAVLSSLASELEESGFPEPMTAEGLQPLREDISQRPAVQWESGDHSGFMISVLGTEDGGNVVWLSVSAPRTSSYDP